jgi:hypothetical protein
VDEIAKRKLKRQYARLNPAQLMREINAIQRKLFRLSTSGTYLFVRKQSKKS